MIPSLRTKTNKKSRGHKYQRKRLRCPKCEYRIIDEGINTTSLLHVMEEGDSWEADYYTKCHNCKSEIGLKKIE